VIATGGLRLLNRTPGWIIWAHTSLTKHHTTFTQPNRSSKIWNSRPPACTIPPLTLQHQPRPLLVRHPTTHQPPPNTHPVLTSVLVPILRAAIREELLRTSPTAPLAEDLLLCLAPVVDVPQHPPEAEADCHGAERPRVAQSVGGGHGLWICERVGGSVRCTPICCVGFRGFGSWLGREEGP
jgi:hypothetical protein